MINVASLLRSAVVAIGATSLTATSGYAGPRVEPVAPAGQVVAVQADCYAIGQQVAAEKGGTLARASLANRGGKQVCVLVVVVPGKDGQRGSRQEIVVPAG